jgi:small subunit ribosomal protein S10
LPYSSVGDLRLCHQTKITDPGQGHPLHGILSLPETTGGTDRTDYGKGSGQKIMAKQKIRIKLKGFDHKIIDQSAEQIVQAVERTGAIVAGPIPLPTHIQKFSVIRSPFIDKDSQEQFEIRTHKRIIDIIETTSKTIDSLTKLNLPAGVEIDIKL